MKNIAMMMTIILSTLGAVDFSATFVDKKWNKIEVPKSEVCSNYNTRAGNTPAIALTHIPVGTSKIILAFSDETFAGMRNEGHGVISYKIPKVTSSITVPSIEGETFDLPKNFSIVTQHRGGQFGKKEGAYLAPCSGGKGNTYSVIIKAVDNDDKILGSTSLTLGKY